MAKPPLHERIKPLGWLRTPLRKAFFGFLRKVSGTPDARALAAETLRGLLNWRPELGAWRGDSAPYPELGQSRLHEQPSQRADAVFIEEIPLREHAGPETAAAAAPAEISRRRLAEVPVIE